MRSANEDEAQRAIPRPGGQAVELDDLETGPLWPISSLSGAGVPLNIVGVYTIWDDGQLIYVGIGGTSVDSWQPNASPPTKSVKGLWGRLEQHRSGDRSGDKFCIYVCDRFVLPTLSAAEIQEVARGELSLDTRTKQWINDRYSFRYVPTVETKRGAAEAKRIEGQVRQGALRAGRPLLNALPP